MTRLSAIALLLRRIRTDRGILLLLFALVAATSFMFAAAPRVLNRVTDDALRYAVTQALPADRDVWLYASGLIQAGNDPGVAAVQAYMLQREADFPTSIDRLISGRSAGLTSVRLAVPQSIVTLSLRYQDRVVDGATLVAGRWPADRGSPLRQIPVGQGSGAQVPGPPRVVEVAMSSAQADAIGAHVGDVLDVGLDASDAFVPNTVFAIAPTQVAIVGVFDPLDASADAWAGNSLLEPSYNRGPEGITAIYATALVAPQAYPRLAAAALPFRYDWHFSVDPARLNAGDVASLQADLQRLQLIAAPTDNRRLNETGSDAKVNYVSIGTGLLGLVDGFSAQRSRTESVASIAALGLLGLAAGATAMLAILLVRRRRTSLLLARGRGASGSLIIGAQLLEAIVLAGTAALIGWLLAVYTIPARDAPLSPILVLLVVATVTVLLVGAAWPAARRPLIELERENGPVFGVSPRRLVIEATLVGVAVVAVALLRDRGLNLGLLDGGQGFDPFLAAVPLLTGFAAGIVAMRVYPLPLRGLGRLAARRSDFVPVIGLRTVARQATRANLPLLVLMLTASFAAFAIVVESSIAHGQVAASYLEVGADYRLEAIGIGGLPPSLDPTAIAGVTGVASGVVDGTADLVIGTNKRARVDFDALDAAAYQAVTAGTPAEPAWPSALFARPSAPGVGTSANPIPAILSSRLPTGMASLHPGDTFTIEVAQQALTLRLVALQDSFPGHGGASVFAIVPLDWVSAATPRQSFVSTSMWVRGSSDAADALKAMVNDAAGSVRLVSRPQAYSLLNDAPLGSSVVNFFRVAVLVAVLYMAITLIGAVMMSAGRRTRDLAYLRTLGVSGRQSQALTAVEHAPGVLFALIPGVLLGVAVALLVEPGLGLADFIGAQGVPLFIDWVTLALVIVCLSLVVAIAILAGTWLAGRTRLASALRIGDS